MTSQLWKWFLLNLAVGAAFVPIDVLAVRLGMTNLLFLFFVEAAVFSFANVSYWRRRTGQVGALYNRLRLYDPKVSMKWHNALLVLLHVFGVLSLGLAVFSLVYVPEGMQGFDKPGNLGGLTVFAIGMALHESADWLARLSGAQVPPFWMRLYKLSSLFVALMGVVFVLVF